jgi:hypothetical protein
VPPRDSFLHNLPPALARAKLDTVHATFRGCGLAPVSFRGGRYSTGPLVQGWLREHGFVADSSVVPFTRWADDGSPDYGGRGPHPVRLAGEPPLWEIPLGKGFTRGPFGFWNRVIAAVEKPPLRYFRLVALLQKSRVVQKGWLNFENPLGEGMLELVRALRVAGVPYLCFTLHSSSLLPGGSPYSATPADVDHLLDRVTWTLKRLAADPTFVPATVADIARGLEASHRARHRDQPAR